MLTKHNVPEMDGQQSGRLGPVPAVRDADIGTESQLKGNISAHELEPDSHIISLYGNTHPSPYELGTLEPPPNAPFQAKPSSPPATTASRSEASPTGEENPKLQLLKDRIEQIRAEKERLKRIQELEELEQQTSREIHGPGAIEEEMQDAGQVPRIRKLEDMEERTKSEILDTTREGSRI